MINVVEVEWVGELCQKEDVSDEVYGILDLIFRVLESGEIPSLNDKEKFWAYATKTFTEHEEDIGNKWLKRLKFFISHNYFPPMKMLFCLLTYQTSLLRLFTFSLIPSISFS